MIRRLFWGTVALATFSSVAAAQQSRGELLRAAQSAYDDFAPERALDLLKAAENPALGPTDTAWVRGIHLLTQILVEGNNQDLARTWARWAARIRPDMAIDTVNFLAGAVTTLREARTATRALTAGDEVTRTSWRWLARGSADTRGRIVAEASNMTTTVATRVVGGALIPAGVGLSLPPGSYEIEAAAPGYPPARLTREVLPGVTTVLTFSLTSAAVASDVIAEPVRQRAIANAAAFSVKRFGVAPSCIAGAFVSNDGLFLTSYQAIRGVESVAGPTPNSVVDLRIAAYDVDANIALLKIPGSHNDSSPVATTIVDGQTAWAIGYSDCRTATDSRVRVSEWTDRPRGALQLSDAPTTAIPGSPMIDVSGKLTGIWTGATTAIPAARAAAMIDVARRNVAQNLTQTLADVARKENHSYGSAIITTDVTAATVNVTPMETWQWSGLAASGPAPLTFAGPVGRYRVAVVGTGDARHEQEMVIRADAEQRVNVLLKLVPAGVAVAVPQQKKKSKLPWILAAVGVGGAGAAALMGGGGSGGGGGGGGPTKGGITIRVPAP